MELLNVSTGGPILSTDTPPLSQKKHRTEYAEGVLSP